MGNGLKFLKYNNAVPIAISLVLVGSTGAFAATDPQAIYSQQQSVVSVDNSFLLKTDLSTYTPQVEITGVTEDDTNYYVAYTLSTIDLQDNAWQPVQKPETMQVSKADLGPYRDLGVYVTQQLGNVVDNELQRLKLTQTAQEASPSQETVVTQYGGLVGKFLNPTTDVLAGYTPVVTASTSSTTSQVAAASEPQPADQAQPAPLPSSTGGSNQGSAQNSGQGQAPAPVSGQVPTIQILGNNPATIPLNSSYNDLGATITGPTTADLGLGIHVFLDGVEVQSIVIDTRSPSTHTIEYQATNQFGTAKADRTLIVGTPTATTSSTSDTSASTSVPSATTTSDSSTTSNQ